MLTEVLIVVLVIGVMTAIAYPVYTKTITKSRAVEAINLLEMVRNKQVANHARKGEYLPTFKNMGQLTSNKAKEVISSGDAILTICKYELAMNTATDCMSVAYIPSPTKPATFTFSSSYEDAGLGCDGAVCKSFIFNGEVIFLYHDFIVLLLAVYQQPMPKIAKARKKGFTLTEVLDGGYIW